MLFKIGEKLSIPDQPVLDQLSNPRTQFTNFKCFQHSWINPYQSRLIECTNHIFSMWMINRRLATHTGIHLRQKCCRNLNKWYATPITVRSKPGHISNHTPTECNDGLLT